MTTFHNIKTHKQDASLPRAVQYALFVVQATYGEDRISIKQLKREQEAVTLHVSADSPSDACGDAVVVITPEEYDEALTWQHSGNHHIFS